MENKELCTSEKIELLKVLNNYIITNRNADNSKVYDAAKDVVVKIIKSINIK